MSLLAFEFPISGSRTWFEKSKEDSSSNKSKETFLSRDFETKSQLLILFLTFLILVSLLSLPKENEKMKKERDRGTERESRKMREKDERQI